MTALFYGGQAHGGRGRSAVPVTVWLDPALGMAKVEFVARRRVAG